MTTILIQEVEDKVSVDEYNKLGGEKTLSCCSVGKLLDPTIHTNHPCDSGGYGVWASATSVSPTLIVPSHNPCMTGIMELVRSGSGNGRYHRLR